ncbi:acyltransferase [Gilvimarinus sp. SDUM040013]|uniref:Acyltransferase n=1 Tax=Gilvimarinus gilvus TaxID=3058038 RepID=A0ABU4RVL2_9GAMM|nr:acyltransferase [Gilvimarinus sp. SDUM040013]MDO3387649.1 acyltransferase [Gilvimarinus sp. SDUM040013]MDX6848910.1 acyltransferase [Gilvimarinus sp. SDUM040013]
MSAEKYQPWYQQRKNELDGLRVLAFGLLILYHLGMAYVADWGWHVKSQYQSEFVQYLMLWSNQWRMSLLFLISGAAIAYQLQRCSGLGFFRRTATRLFVPLVFGSVFIVAPQVYIEIKSETSFDLDYVQFWWQYIGFGELPHVYIRLVPTNLTYNHLWYLCYLFAYITILWLLYPFVRRVTASPLARVLVARMPGWSLLLVPAVGVFLIGELLWEAYPTTFTLVDDWYNHARYVFVFLLGFGVVQSNRLWQAFKQYRYLSLTLGVICYLVIVFLVNGGSISHYLPLVEPIEGYVKGAIWSANSWLWISAVLGFGQALLARPKAWVQRANRAVFCFYILHQTLIVVSVYALANMTLGPILEPLLVLIITLAVSLAGYRLASRYTWLGAVLGVKPEQGDSVLSAAIAPTSVAKRDVAQNL